MLLTWKQSPQSHLKYSLMVMNVSQSGLDRRLLQHAKSSWWRRLQPNQGLRNATVSFQNGPHHPISCKDPTRIQQGHVSEPKWEFREEWRKLKISQKIWDRMPEETQVCSLVRSLVQYVVIRCHEYATSDMLWTRLCPPPSSYIEIVIPNVKVFRDEAFRG